MSVEMFLVIYVVLVVLLVSLEIYLLFNNKAQHLRVSYKALKYIYESYDAKDIETLFKETIRFYEEYVQEEPQIRKFFPNAEVWLDAIIFRVSCGYKHASVLKEYEIQLKNVKDEYEYKNPFSKCEKVQQGILRDIIKIETDDNALVVQNIVERTEEEFKRLSNDIKKNSRANTVSIAIGIIGIFVSVLMAMVKF